MNFKHLNKKCNEIRREILDISFLKKAHHIGSEMSIVEILVALYFKVMSIGPKISKDKRDYFILSKGHAALALYVVLMMKGYFSKKYLIKNFLTDGGLFGGHPDKFIKYGIEISSGSLGYGPSIGCGLAYSLKKTNRKVFVLVGDGELNEGMIWESVLFAAHHKLDNLYLLIDYNNLQGYGTTNKTINLQPLSKKFRAFGWNAINIDGHNIEQIEESINVKLKNKLPTAIICKTIKGKGIKKMENKLSSHYETLSEFTYEEYKKDLQK